MISFAKYLVRNLIVFFILCQSAFFLQATNSRTAPEIKHLDWGKIEVREIDGNITTYKGRIKDCIITPSGSLPWDWKKTNMHHKPGIRVEDVKPFLNQADIFVLSCGMDLVLQVMDETKIFLEQHGKEVHVLQSEQAMIKFNELAPTKRVIVFLHSTC